MKKSLLSLLCGFMTISFFAQAEKFPVFKDCDSTDVIQLEVCFKNTLKKLVTEEFKIPKEIQDENFEGNINIVFVVDDNGVFKIIYANSPYPELKKEAERVFGTLPKIKPASYNNHPVEMRFVFPLAIPLSNNSKTEAVVSSDETKAKELFKIDQNIVQSKLFPEHHSDLNIPFVHSTYQQYDYGMNRAANSHTAVKPYLYNEVKEYVNLEASKNKLLKQKNTWFGRKLLNEHMAFVKGDHFWFTIDPMVDLQLGHDSEGGSTYNNTRAIRVSGGLGKNLNFSASFYESQGSFAKYFNDYAEFIKPDGGNPALIPGRGIAKEHNDTDYDYPVTEAYLSYTPSKTFNFQFGHGKNFIGDGYRSMILSDGAMPYTFFKINTKFWKIKYTNLWMWMQDVRKELTEDGAFRQKYMAIHYLSWNVSKKLNLGFFETVIWDNVNDRGFDVTYLNPLIFYTAAEFSTGTRAGNAFLGLTMKYKLKDNMSVYSQLLFDELRISEFTSSDGWWGNKFGFQLGAKYHNAFNIENLYLQAEYNAIRPFTYSHDELNYNFGHSNQPLAHLWGSNLREFIGIVDYTKDRWFARAKLLSGIKGFDYANGTDTASYGGDIFVDNDDRAYEYDNKIGQGNKAHIFVADFQVGYLVNPATNLKLFGGLMFRKFDADAPITGYDLNNTTWVSFGLKTDVFNWYFDF